MTETAQSNPILYVMPGESASSFLPLLEKTVCSYIGNKGTGYLPVTEAIRNGRLPEEINRLQTCFLTKSYTATGIIRVNYLLTADDPDCLALPEIKKQTEQFLLRLYPAGILTDIYVLLNDADLFNDERPVRRQIMQVATTEQANGSMVYLLSNVNSLNMHTRESHENMMRSIALLAVFKDCDSPRSTSYVAELDASRYKEQYFTDNCYAGNGVFLTAGRFAVNVPRAALKALLMHALLTYSPKEHSTDRAALDLRMPTAINPYASGGSPELFALAVPPVRKDEFAKRTRRYIINRLFGNRLDAFFDLRLQDNPPPEQPDDATITNRLLRILEKDHHFNTLYRMTEPAGPWRKAIEQILYDQTEALDAAENKLNQWLSMVFNPQTDSGEKRKLSPLSSEDGTPYKLAGDYLRMKFNIHTIKETIDYIHRVLLCTEAYHHQLAAFKTVVDHTTDTFQTASEPLQTSLPFHGKANAYFLAQLDAFIQKNIESVTPLVNSMTAFLRENTFDQYITLLQEFVDEAILPSPFFNKSFMETWTALCAPQNPYTLLGDLIIQNRQLNIFLKTGYTGLYGETNILMTENGAGETKRYIDHHAREKTNMFTHPDADGIEVLYHAGAFNTDDLYYKDFYS